MTSPSLLEFHRAGIDTAASLLAAAGDKPIIIISDGGAAVEVQLETLDVATLAGGFHMRVNDEDIFLSVNDAPRFESELRSRME